VLCVACAFLTTPTPSISSAKMRAIKARTHQDTPLLVSKESAEDRRDCETHRELQECDSEGAVSDVTVMMMRDETK
jgi:hypothetical protein